MTDSVLQQIQTEGRNILDETQAEKVWGEIVKTAPAIGRLPEMVASMYPEECFSSTEEFKKELALAHSRTKRGLLMFNAIFSSQGLNYFFETYDVKFGTAIDITMEYIEGDCAEEESHAKEYTRETLCGWLFANLALEITRESMSEFIEAFEVDEEYDADLHRLVGCNTPLLVLATILANVRSPTPECAQEIYAAAKGMLHSVTMALVERTKNDVLH